MRAATANLASTVDDRDQTVAYTFTMNLPGGLYPDLSMVVEAIHVEGDTVTDQVGGTRLDDGYTAFEATVTVSGFVDGDETKTAAWLFARYPYLNAPGGIVSPLAYQDMHDREVSIGFGPSIADATEVFYGFVDSYEQNSDGQVEFTLIDCRTILRPVAQLPAVITAPPYNAGLTSEFALDYLLRASTKGVVSSWPAQRTGCVLAVGMRSSIWPEVGSISQNANQSPRFAPGINGTALSQSVTLDNETVLTSASITYQLSTPVTGSTVTVEFFATINNTNTTKIELRNSANVPLAQIILQPNTLEVDLRNSPDADFWGIPVSPGEGPHRVTLTLTWPIGSTSWSVVAILDGTYYSSGTRTTSTARANSPIQYAAPVLIINGSTSTPALFEAFQVTSEAAPTQPVFTPRAVLDPSLNPLQVVPPMEGDAWQTIQDIAAAELGVAGFFGGRVFRFYNRRSITGRSSVKDVTSDGALETLGVTSERAGIVNYCSVGYTGWTFATARSTVYSAESVIKVPRQGTKIITVNLDGYAVAVDNTVGVLGDGVNDPTQSWMRVATDAAGSRSHPGGVTARLTSVAPDKITVTFTNTSSTDGYLVSSASYTDVPAGTPLFTLAGRAVTPADEITATYQWPTPELGGAGSSRFGQVPAEITGNQWIQDPDAAGDLCKSIVLDNYQPRCEFTNVAIRPDPRLEPADSVHIVDPDRTGVDEYVRLFGFELDYEADGDGGTARYEMSINARAFGPPGAWLLGIKGRSELGSTTYLR